MYIDIDNGHDGDFTRYEVENGKIINMTSGSISHDSGYDWRRWDAQDLDKEMSELRKEIKIKGTNSLCDALPYMFERCCVDQYAEALIIEEINKEIKEKEILEIAKVIEDIFPEYQSFCYVLRS